MSDTICKHGRQSRSCPECSTGAYSADVMRAAMGVAPKFMSVTIQLDATSAAQLERVRAEFTRIWPSAPTTTEEAAYIVLAGALQERCRELDAKAARGEP